MNDIYKIFSRIFIITIIIKVLDIFKNLIIASKFGVSSSADIYMAVVSIPDSMLILLGLDTIRGVINSEYSALFSKGKENIIFISYKNIFNLLLIIAVFLLIASYIFRENIISALLPGFSGERYYKAISISLIIFPIVFFKLFLGFFQSIYNAFRKFYSPIVLPIIGTIIVFIAIYIPYYKSDLIYNLSFANLIGNFIIVLIMFYGVLKIGGRPNLKYFEIDELTKKIIKNCLSLFILVLCNQLFLVSRNFFASYFGDGAISSLNYASYIPLTISTLSFTIIFSVLLSNLSSSFASKRRSIARKLFVNTFLGLFFIFIPVCIFLIIFKYEVLKLVFLRGNFDLEGLNKVINPFIWETLSLLTFVIYIIPTALYLAKKEYFLMTKIGSLVYLLGILLNFILVRYIDYYGVSISHFFITTLYGYLLLLYSRRFLGRYGIYVRHFLLLIVSGIITSIPFYFLKELFSNIFKVENIIINISSLVISSILLFILYLLITSIFNVNYLFRLKEIIFSKNYE